MSVGVQKVFNNNTSVYFQKKVNKQPSVNSKNLSSNYSSDIPFKSLYSKNSVNYLTFQSNYKISFAGAIHKILNVAKEPDYKYYPFDPKNIWHGEGNGSNKKWIVANPSDLLKRSLVDSIYDIKNLTGLDYIPENINTPTVCGDNWGRRSNYIEIIPRALGKPRKDGYGCIIMREGMVGAINMLTSIPPGSDGCPNCVLLCGVLPTIMGDGFAHGHKEDSSLYTMDIDRGFSRDLSSEYLESKGVTTEDQIKAFNDLAHLKGLKTGVFMVLSEDQIKINGNQFRWNSENIEKFIQKCCYLVDLGFDAFYFDSARHIGGTDQNGNYIFNDSEHYQGVGRLPNYWDIQHITYEIRQRTGRPDISFIGERCDFNNRYKEMGFNAGVGFVNPDDVNKEAKIQNNSPSYASGPVVSTDNDLGLTSYNDRLEKLREGLWNDGIENDKIPMLMTMTDLWPLNHYTNEHELMLKNKVFTAYGNPEQDDVSRHQENLFVYDDSAYNYSKSVNKEFSKFINS